MSGGLTNADFRRKLAAKSGVSDGAGAGEQGKGGRRADSKNEVVQRDNLKTFVRQEVNRERTIKRRGAKQHGKERFVHGRGVPPSGRSRASGSQLARRSGPERGDGDGGGEGARAGRGRARPKYRDRAAERRTGKSDYDESAVQMAANVDHDLSKMLGGDEEHTHLVKGLDVVLLERVRKQLEEAEAGAGDRDGGGGAPPAAAVPEGATGDELLLALGPGKAVEDVKFHTLLGRSLTANVLLAAAARPGVVGQCRQAFLPGRTAYDFPTDPFARNPWEPLTVVARSAEDCPDPGDEVGPQARLPWRVPQDLADRLAGAFGGGKDSGARKARRRRRRREEGGDGGRETAAAVGEGGTAAQAPAADAGGGAEVFGRDSPVERAAAGAAEGGGGGDGGGGDASGGGGGGGGDGDDGDDDNDDDIFAGVGRYDPAEGIARDKRAARAAAGRGVGGGYFGPGSALLEGGVARKVDVGELARTVKQLAAQQRRKAEEEAPAPAAAAAGARFAGLDGGARGHSMADALRRPARGNDEADAYTAAMDGAMYGDGGDVSGAVAEAVRAALPAPASHPVRVAPWQMTEAGPGACRRAQEKRGREAAAAEARAAASKRAELGAGGVPRAALLAQKKRQRAEGAGGDGEEDAELDAWLGGGGRARPSGGGGGPGSPLARGGAPATCRRPGTGASRTQRSRRTGPSRG